MTTDKSPPLGETPRLLKTVVEIELISIPVVMLVDLLLCNNEFVTFDIEHYAAERYIVDALRLTPISDPPVFHLHKTANGLLRLYKWSTWLTSDDHRRELRASMEVHRVKFDETKASRDKLFCKLRDKFGLQQAYFMLDNLENMPELKEQFGL